MKKSKDGKWGMTVQQYTEQQYEQEVSSLSEFYIKQKVNHSKNFVEKEKRKLIQVSNYHLYWK